MITWGDLLELTFEQRPEGDNETSPSDTWGRAVQVQRASNAKPQRRVGLANTMPKD